MKFILSGALMVILAVCYFILNTTAGLQLLLKGIPGTVLTESSSGSLYRGFSLEGLRITDSGYQLDIDHISADWRPLALLTNRLHLNAINIEGLVIMLNAGVDGQTSKQADLFKLPLAVTLDSLKISGVMISDKNKGALFQATQLAVTAHTEDQLLIVDNINLSSPDYEAAISGQIDLTESVEHQMSIDWLFRGSESLEVAGNTVITGTRANTNIKSNITAPLNGTIDLTLRQPAEDLSWMGTATITNVNPASYINNFPEQSFNLELSATGTATAAHITGDVRLADRVNPVTPSAGAGPAYEFKTFETNFILDTAGMLTGQPELTGKLHWDGIRLASVATGKELDLDNGGVDMHFRDGRIQIQSRSAFTYDIETAGDWTISATGNADMLEINTIRLTLAEGVINGVMSIDRTAPVMVFDGSANWDSLAIPGVFDRLLTLSAGSFALTGSSEDYHLTVSTDISVDDRPPLKLAISAAGDQALTTINTLTLNGFSGSVTGTGSVDWLNGAHARMQLTGTGLDPGGVWTEWPGKLNLHASIDALKLDDGLEVNIDDVSIAGSLRELPVDLALSGRFTPGLIEISQARLTRASSTVELAGNWGTQTGIDWVVESPDLSMLHPEIRGQLSAQGRVSGTIGHPLISAVLAASAINSPWGSLGQADARVNINGENVDRIDIKLEAQDLSWQSTQLDEFSVVVTGATSGHDYAIQVGRENQQLLASGQGKYANTEWHGNINKLEVIADASGESWMSMAPVGLSLAREMLKLEEVCLLKGPARICGQFDRITADNWEAQLHANELPVAMLRPYLPEYVDLAGQASIDIAMFKPANQALTGNGSVHITAGEILMHIEGEKFETIPVSGIDARFDLTEGVLDGRLDAEAADTSIAPLSARLKLSGLESLQPDFTQVDIEGSINWKMNDLSMLSVVVPQITDTQGEIDVDLSFTGTADSPQMQGQLMLSKAGFMVPELGIALENIEVQGNSITDGSYTVEGRVSSAGGELTLTSEINHATGEDYAVTARINGTNFEIINSPEIRALASPDLDVIVTGTSTDVKGTISISDALINLGEFRESVALSEDVVFKDRVVPERGQSRVTAAVQIEFGDRIDIQGQGLSGKLTGTLDVYTNDSGELLGKGEVAIREGKFSAYGQSLVIEEGKLIFQGNRLNNPELRVSAIRRIDDTITVGLKVSGYASNPLVTLFSTSALGDDEILAYIVFGRPISSLTSGEGSDLIGAATAMGLKNSGFLTRSLSSTFGLDKLQFTSDSTGTNASLEIGKYLTPKLYLSYAMGVFERIATAQIRYDLNTNWSLEVKSSTDVGVDLYYNIQK